MYRPTPRQETDIERITRLLNGNHRRETEAVEAVIRELLDVVQKFQSRVEDLEQQGRKNSIAFSTLETEAEVLRSRIKELESHIIDIREEFRNKE